MTGFRAVKKLNLVQDAAEGYGIWPIGTSLVATSGHHFNVKAYGAAGDGESNDLPAFRRTADAVNDAGGGHIFIPPGTYPFATAETNGGMVQQWANIETDGVTIEWAPGATITSTVTNARVLVIAGHAKPAGAASWDAYEYVDATGYTLSGTSTKGRNTVTTATAADAGNFAAGDWVTIATGQTTNGSAAGQPDSEINRVKSVNAGSGVVTLSWPLLATYAQEYYVSGTTGITTTTPTANLAPYVIRKVSDRTLHAIRLVNPQIECASGTLQALSIWAATDVKVEGGTILFNNLGFGSRDVRFCEVDGTRFDHRSDGTADRYALAPSTGCANWYAHGFEIVSDAAASLDLHEAIKAGRFVDGAIHAANAATVAESQVLDVAARLYDTVIQNVDVSVNASAESNAVLIDAVSNGGGNVLRNVRVKGANALMNIRCDADGWTGFETCTVTNGRFSLRAPQIGKGQETGTRVLSGWVYGTTGAQQLTPTLGTLPRHAVPLRVTLYVQTAFDGSGTDNIKLGYSGTTNAYATDTDVSTTGVKAPTAGANLLIPEPTADRAVVATYTAGGGAPTVGKAFVTLEYALGARID
jgi:hypothetical protein